MTPHPITSTPKNNTTESPPAYARPPLSPSASGKRGQTVGVVTWRDLHQAEAWDDVDFGGSESNSLLERLTAKEFMAYVPITISPDATIGEAAY